MSVARPVLKRLLKTSLSEPAATRRSRASLFVSFHNDCRMPKNDGETVPIDELFSNGANWPGDSFRLPVEEVANCHCEVVVTLPD